MKHKSLASLKGSLTGWTVLIVDDTPDNVTVMKTALQFYGAQVYTARNGEEGLALLKSVTPTVILLDIRMPKMDGWSMFHTVREDPKLASIPIIAITAYAMPSDRERILGIGFNGYISKPFDLSTFVEETERVVEAATQKLSLTEEN